MSEHSAENDAPCPVPECEGGYIRLPVVVERTMYGHTEKFVEFDSYQCEGEFQVGMVR